MRAGALDTRVTFEAPSRSYSPDRTVQTSWSPVARVWASVRLLRGSERFQAAKNTSVESGSLWIRWRHVDPSWRVVMHGKPYKIVGLSPIGRKKGLEIAIESYGD